MGGKAEKTDEDSSVRPKRFENMLKKPTESGGRKTAPREGGKVSIDGTSETH